MAISGRAAQVPGPASVVKSHPALSIRVVGHQDRTVQEALRLLREQLRNQAVNDRTRRRWGADFHENPGYVRRQQKFFAKARARKCEMWLTVTGRPYPLRW